MIRRGVPEGGERAWDMQEINPKNHNVWCQITKREARESLNVLLKTVPNWTTGQVGCVYNFRSGSTYRMDVAQLRLSDVRTCFANRMHVWAGDACIICRLPPGCYMWRGLRIGNYI
ncbi:MAG: hypothetical protein AB8G77_15885 [Rhodothermales bacterium]